MYDFCKDVFRNHSHFNLSMIYIPDRYDSLTLGFVLDELYLSVDIHIRATPCPLQR